MRGNFSRLASSTREFLRARPNQAKAVLRAFSDAVKLGRENKELFHRAIRKYLKEDNQGVEFIGPQCDEAVKGMISYEGHGVSPRYHSSLFVYDAATNSLHCAQGKTLKL